jgi:hypothetical protein
LASEALTGFGELKISSSSSSCVIITINKYSFRMRGVGKGWRKRTVLFFVSGIQKYITKDWMPHHMVKIMYVLQPILSIDTGHANWFSIPAIFQVSKLLRTKC